MKPGTVFKWNRFPFPKYGGKLKPRWFICLGETGILSTPVIAYLCTTTTALNDFTHTGKRASHRYLLFERARYSFFDEDCILDYDEEPYSIEKELLEKNPSIEIRGELDRECLKIIYRGIRASNHYSHKIQLDIHTSLNLIGVTGLTKP